MILDLTKTEELCRKLREVTGKAVSLTYKIFLHTSGDEVIDFRIWADDLGVKEIGSIDKLNTWLEYTIEYQQKTQELTND